MVIVILMVIVIAIVMGVIGVLAWTHRCSGVKKLLVVAEDLPRSMLLDP